MLGALLAAGQPVQEDSRAAVPAVKPKPSRIDLAVLAEFEVEEGSWPALGSVIAPGAELVNVLRRVRCGGAGGRQAGLVIVFRDTSQTGGQAPLARCRCAG